MELDHCRAYSIMISSKRVEMEADLWHFAVGFLRFHSIWQPSILTLSKVLMTVFQIFVESMVETH